MIYIATEDIFTAPGVRAFREGARVPESAVGNLDIADKVRRVDAAPAPRTSPAPRPPRTPEPRTDA